MIKRIAAAALATSLMLLTPAVCRGAEISVSAESAVLMCAEDNSVIFQKNPKERLPMASTTKIMTCLVALEHGNLSDVVEVSPSAVGVEGSSLYLQKGDSLTLEGLLYALMLRSANDCAEAIAYHIAGSIDGFAELMNAKAAELGLSDTHFANPHGLGDENHYTTAYDFALLASFAMKNPDFAKIVSTLNYNVELNDGSCRKAVVNHNKLLRTYDGACGVKTGFTKASGRCLVSSAEKNGVLLVAVTLNAPDDWRDHKAMLDYGFSVYERVTLYGAGELRRTFDVAGFGQITASNSEEISRVVKKGDRAQCRIIARRLMFAPISKGDEIARAEILVNGAAVCSVPLYAESDAVIPREKSLIEKIGSFFDFAPGGAK